MGPVKMLVPILMLVLLASVTSGIDVGDMEIVAEWVQLEFEWPSEQEKNDSITNGSYIPDNNIITGLKVSQDGDVYVTVSRWLPGVPSTMNKLAVKSSSDTPVLVPYPSWEMQTIDDCDAFQFTQSMEIDPMKNHMWVIDTGRLDIWLNESVNNCPPKLRILDLYSGKVVHTYTFPDAVLSHTQNFVNDIVIDPANGMAYMSDTGISSTGHSGGIVVYDYKADKSWRLEHWSMEPEVNAEDGEYYIYINGQPYLNSVPSDGIALTWQKDTVFYCPLGGVHLYQVATSDLRTCNQSVCQLSDYQVIDMGPKVSESDGMLFGHQALYYAGLGMNAIYRWPFIEDMEEQDVSDWRDVNMTSQVLVKQDNVQLIWSDTFSLSSGWLYTTANRLPLFKSGELDYTGESGSNFRIAKIYVNDYSYLETIVSSAFTISTPLLLIGASLGLQTVRFSMCS